MNRIEETLLRRKYCETCKYNRKAAEENSTLQLFNECSKKEVREKYSKKHMYDSFTSAWIYSLKCLSAIHFCKGKYFEKC